MGMPISIYSNTCDATNKLYVQFVNLSMETLPQQIICIIPTNQAITNYLNGSIQMEFISALSGTGRHFSTFT